MPRLNRVESIREYLDVSPRMLRQLIRDGCPVHKDPDRPHRVFAFTEELDAWDHDRAHRAEGTARERPADCPKCGEKTRHFIGATYRACYVCNSIHAEVA